MKWYQKNWVIILLLIFFFPVGIFLMWRYSSWNKIVKVIITGILAFACISSFFDSNDSNNALLPTSSPTPIVTSAPTLEPTSTPTMVPTPAPTVAPIPTIVPTPAPTVAPTPTPFVAQETTSQSSTTKTGMSASSGTSASSSSEATVYIGNTGDKYHRASCSTLKGKGHAISLDKALAEGRTACKRCKP